MQWLVGWFEDPGKNDFASAKKSALWPCPVTTAKLKAQLL